MSKVHHPSSLRGLFLVVVMGIAFAASAQFTYFGGGLSYTPATYSGNYPGATEKDKAVHQVLDFTVQALFRPFHNLGFGIGVGLPVSDNSDWAYRRTSLFYGGSGFYGFPTAGLAGYRYVPQVYTYTFERSLATTLQLRLFAGTKIDSYLDFQMSFYSLEESFQFQRAEVYGNDDGGYIPATSFAFEKTHQMSPFGLSMGIMPRFKGGVYMDLNVGFDMLQFSGPGFQFPVEHNWDYYTSTHEVVTLTSHARGSTMAFRMHAGLGYSF